MCCLLLHQQEREDILDALSDPSDDEDKDYVPEAPGEDSSDEEPIMKNVQVRFPKGVRILSEQGIGINQLSICMEKYIKVDVKMVLDNKSYTVGKPNKFPNKWCPICKEHAFMG